MKTINLLLFLFCLSLLYSSCQKETDQTNWSLSSPDGQVRVKISSVHSQDNNSNISLEYSVWLKGSKEEKEIVKPSPLGIIRQDQDFSDNLKFIKASPVKTIDEEYEMLSGKQLKNRNHANELVLSFKNDQDNNIDLIFRAYNEGIAFCYSFPGKTESPVTIKKELTGFQMPGPGDAWIQPYDTIGTWSPAYEFGYIKDVKIGDRPPMTTGWGFPALFRTGGSWVFLTESGVYDSFCGSHLDANCDNGLYRIEYPHEWENYGLGDALPSWRLPWKLPWRVVLVSDELHTIVESNIVHHLAKPNQLEDVSWIEPGNASWSWWGDHESGKNFAKLRDYVDFAAEMGWRYSLVDADWHIMEGGTLKELAEYAETKNVGLLIWYNSGGPHTKVMNAGPRDLMHKPEIRKKEFQRISEMGIKGIKVDFFQSDKQDIIQLYLDIARDAAMYKILLNTHGCTIPRGWTRTFPNFLAMEGVRGAELYGYHKFPPRAVWLNTVYPFTRNVIGPMDYTPVTFTDYKEESAHITTFAHELALSVVFECGIQHFADRIEGYKSLPEKPYEFLKQVPNTWDNTWFVTGFPGRDVVIARKKDDTYFVAGINGEMKPKEISFKLDFLPEGTFSFNLIKDGEDDRSFSYENTDIDKSTTISVKLLPAGGFAAILEP